MQLDSSKDGTSHALPAPSVGPVQQEPPDELHPPTGEQSSQVATIVTAVGA